ncbi:lipase family protein [Streptomyces sp. NPDC001941]|uniref:lipase family protein n=1 Tax=Streptomyces sp. NPDC001941 TaxID=3154659 RepID=UPI0033191016
MRISYALSLSLAALTAVAAYAAPSHPAQAASAPPAAAPFAGLPDTEPDDPFYRHEGPFTGRHGALLDSRKLEGPAALSHASRNDLVLYESKGVRADEEIAVSGIVALPDRTKHPVPEGGYPVVSWAHGTVGVADKCAPSMDSEQLADPARPDDPMHTHRKINLAPQPMLNAFLDKGWAVVMTDYQGSGTKGPHPYLNGKAEGRGVLDIVRAARELHNSEERLLSDEFTIVGHSQGGHAALFAGSYAPTWTPELKLRGVAPIAPASYQGGKAFQFPGLWALRALTGDLASNTPFLAMAVAGAAAEHPELDVDGIFTARGRELYAQDVASKCRAELSAKDSFGGNGAFGTRKALFAGSALTRAPEVLRKHFADSHPDLPIAAPVRMSQAKGDTRVESGKTDSLVTELKKRNGTSRMTYVTYEKGEVATPDPAELGEHFGILTTDIAPLTAWLAERLAK